MSEAQDKAERAILLCLNNGRFLDNKMIAKNAAALVAQIFEQAGQQAMSTPANEMRPAALEFDLEQLRRRFRSLWPRP